MPSIRSVKVAIRKLKPARKKRGATGVMLCKLRLLLSGEDFLTPIILTKNTKRLNDDKKIFYRFDKATAKI
jgi:hypothetical protein